MHILVTNDDGVLAPGLLTLATALRPLGQVTVLAPDRNWSASGHVKTMHRPLRAAQTQLADGSAAWSCNGAPSDCVALALLGFLDEPIDLIAAGINPSANFGHDVTYSGTVTAAMEAAISGVPGIAFSLDAPDELGMGLDFSRAGQIVTTLMTSLLSMGLPKSLLLNVNIPYGENAGSAGFSITRQGLRLYRDELVERLDPRGRPYYWIGGEAPSGVADPGTDFWAISQDLVSITPLQLDLTDHKSVQTLQPLAQLHMPNGGT